MNKVEFTPGIKSELMLRILQKCSPEHRQAIRDKNFFPIPKQSTVVAGMNVSLSNDEHGRCIAELHKDEQYYVNRLNQFLTKAHMEEYAGYQFHDLNFPDKLKYFEGVRQGKSLLFAGNTGTGKTTLAVCIAKEIAKRGISVGFVRWSNMYAELKESNSSNEITEKQVHEKYYKPQILVVDELGREEKERAYDYEVDSFFRLISERDASRKQYIITTNLDYQGLQGLYGKATVDRMINKRKVMIKLFQGVSYRQK